ncbi:acyltransferase family protein [Stenotrophobium rhamnosiphilum]|uniref:Acyltransferase n=1 Tax=Stenotrophobium rhamnosiphilum TaxID=2029166 RepID=A0A2T5MK09_9GAMM|nr:acyltransferase [Stenotrophobium rhamnosiphilum]PTU32911.1 acyltransferase [Stenotrophobium rhamnosiphilum]
MKQNEKIVKESERFFYIDSLRGIAALLVVFQHDFVPLLGGDSDHFFWRYVLDAGKMGVIWFFIISGFVIPYSLKEGEGALRNFAISRFLRLYPAYWLSMGCALLAMSIAGAVMPPTRLILANITMFQTALGIADLSPVYWTLFIELVFYIICASAFAVGLLGKIKFRLTMVIGMMVLAMLMGVARDVFNMRFPVALPLALSLMFFGSIWRDALVDHCAVAKKYATWVLALYCFAMPLTFYMAYRTDMGYGETWTRYACTYAFSIATFIFFTQKFRITGRFWVWTGAISYSVYLFHPLVIRMVAYWLTPFDFPVLLVAVIAVASTLLVAHLVYTLVEKRFINLGRTLQRRPVKPVAVTGP